MTSVSSSYFQASPTGRVIRAQQPTAVTTQVHLVLSLQLWVLKVCFLQGHLESVSAVSAIMKAELTVPSPQPLQGLLSSAGFRVAQQSGIL